MIRKLSILFIGMVIIGCASGGSTDQPARGNDPQMVLGKAWQWEATVTPVERITAAAPERYTIMLAADGKANVRFDCNRGGGEYTIAPGKLSFGPMMSTRMACPPDTQDHLFMRDLQRVTSFFIDNGTLYMELPNDSGTMKFRTAP